MTKPLEEALAAVSQLPETDQDAIATIIIEKIATKEISTLTLSPADIESLEKLYTFRVRTKVLQVLQKYSFLVTTLQSVPDNIRNYFPDSQLFLEVVTDPEITDYLQLFILIATNIEPDEAMDRLDKFENDWWLHTPYEVRSLVCIDVEYQ